MPLELWLKLIERRNLNSNLNLPLKKNKSLKSLKYSLIKDFQDFTEDGEKKYIRKPTEFNICYLIKELLKENFVTLKEELQQNSLYSWRKWIITKLKLHCKENTHFLKDNHQILFHIMQKWIFYSNNRYSLSNSLGLKILKFTKVKF